MPIAEGYNTMPAWEQKKENKKLKAEIFPDSRSLNSGVIVNDLISKESNFSKLSLMKRIHCRGYYVIEMFCNTNKNSLISIPKR